MRKVQNWGDNRNKGSCVHCGGPNETRDHGPSIVFLDEPLPPNLPASPSCARCNQGFSDDEAYLACLLECVIVGSTDLSKIERQKVAALMRNRPTLAADLASARHEKDGWTVFSVDTARVERVVLKLARCHVAYELNEPRIDEPDSILFRPLTSMSELERGEFENESGDSAIFPEVGSRAMQRLLVVGDEAFDESWLEVQPGRYRFCALPDRGPTVRMVLREYLACEVRWG